MLVHCTYHARYLNITYIMRGFVSIYLETVEGRKAESNELAISTPAQKLFFKPLLVISRLPAVA